ncbi:MAG TPA: adenylyltransferase/cytidyltransferase family protein [Tenuifilaceae bacterium]|nr:adenylyltransferase/cytidyltransferase family protein [Tenuifilaceae bacterium]
MDKREILYGKILSKSELKRKLAFWRYKDQRIVMVYGTFETLKPGIVDMIMQAANQGDVLLVALRSDRLVHKQKGEGSPQFNQFNRAYVLASLLQVSGIVVVEEDELGGLIEQVHPGFTAFCKHATDEEKKLFRSVVDWGGEFAEFDSDKILTEPVSIEGEKAD